MRTLATTLSLVALLAVVPAPARAQKPPDATVLRQAKKLFAEAETHYKQGNYDDAIRGYREVYALAPRPELLFNIAQGLRLRAAKTGSLADQREAVDHYQRFLTLRPAGPVSDEARGFMTALESSLARAEAGTQARERDTQRLEQQRLEAGQRQAAESVARKQREAEALAQARRADEEAARRTLAEQRRLTDIEESRASRRRRYLMAALGTGLASLALVAAGATYAALARNTSDQLSPNGDHGKWTKALDDLVDKGSSSARNSAILFGAAGAFAAATGVLVYVGFRRTDEAVRVTLQPLASPTLGGMLLGGQF